jgi:hypothetical protein
VLDHDYGPFNRGEPEPSCYALAFGLDKHPRYLALVAAKQGSDQPITSKVVMGFIEAKLLRPRRVAAKVGDIVLYFADGVVKHAGIVIGPDGRISSKWGQAEVHEHGLWEVPIGYGDTAAVYLPCNPETLLAVIEPGEAPASD